MNNAIIPQTKRRPGRPKKSVNISSFNKLTTYAPKRRAAAPQGVPDEIEIVDFNGFEGHAKRAKADDQLQPKRSQPPRRARFTESYGGTAQDVVVISDEDQDDDDSESESDSDCGPVPSPVLKVRSKEEQAQWEDNVQTLKKALSDEEMKLVLLRKLQESQKTKDPKREAAASPVPVPSALKTSSITLKGGVQIQPLPSKQLLTNNKYLSAKKDVKQEIPPNNRSLAKPSSSTSFKPIQPPLKPRTNSPIALTVPKSVEALSSNHLNQYPLLKNLSNQITITAVPSASSPSVSSKAEEKMDAETLHQRQAAAKLALRKQLEKTLLQIPLPKPPPLKINFFPNANSIEFLCLLGLDYVVDCLTKSKKNSQAAKVPLTCAQCGTDFTCTWKWKEVDKNGKKAYDAYCEACITSNIRKALKAQHTNNLKSAFLKALQQEKEIDRLTLSTAPKALSSVAPKALSSVAPKALSSVAPKASSHQRANRVPAPAHQASSNFSLPKTSAGMPYIPKAPQGLNHAALAQFSKLSPQYQSLFHAQVQAQQLLAGVQLHPSVLSLTPFMGPGAPNHGSRGKPPPSQNDQRRQRYRGNEKVQSPSIQPASSSWKA